MNKISFSQLERARQNPIAFAKSLADDKGGTGRYSKYMAWQNSVFHYHKNRGDLAKAIKYFESTFLKNFADNAANQVEREDWILELQAYTKDETKKRLTYVEHKKRLSIAMNSELRLGGELPLIKMNNKGGYSVYFFSRDDNEWEDELRFPILQSYIATTLYNVALNEVEVGVYSIPKQKHLQRSYSRKEVRIALDELDEVGSQIASAL